MFIFILRVILLFWIISIVARWFRRFNFPPKDTDTVEGNRQNANSPVDMNYTGKIDDAEFEEIDGE